MSTRRQILGGTAALAAGLGLAACGTNSGEPGDAEGAASLRLAWWGNDTRNSNTEEMITAFTDANPDISVTGEAGEWATYWQRLATQVAGSDSPDVIQMSINFVREYADRGALLDLNEAGVNSDDFAPGTLESGQVSGALYAINAGVNTSVIIANPTLFDEAGIELPDDTTWTWESYGQLAAELTGALGDGRFGSTTFWGASDTMLNAWLRQHGKALYTPDGLGFTAEDVVGWFELLLSFQAQQSIPDAAQSAEEDSLPLTQQLAATKKAAMALYYSNQIAALDDATGQDLVLLRPPSVAGDAQERQAWFNASMQWVISAATDYPDAAAALVNYLVNDVDAAKIQLAERGLPPNLTVREAITPMLSESDQKAAAFLNDIEPELGPSPEIPLVGISDMPSIYARYCQEVAFERQATAVAAEAFVAEVQDQLARA